MNALPKRAKARREPVYLRLREMVDPDTGEIRAAFVAANREESQVLRARKLQLGDVYRCELHKPRSAKHHRLVMATIAFLVDSCEIFDTIEQALIAVKIGMGYCDPVIHIDDKGRTRTAYIPASISFDSLDEDAFAKFHVDLVRFISKRYLPDMTPEQVEAAVELMKGTDG